MSGKSGRITKGVGGICTVFAGGDYYRCVPRGLFRNTGETPLVGDLVEFSVTDEEKKEGTLHTIKPRANRLARPPAANVDQAIITVCEKEPELNPGLLDRFLVLAADAGVDALICANKSAGLSAAFEPYVAAGYGVNFTDALSGYGMEGLRGVMAGKTSLFAGPSGVGKSTLINALNPSLGLETGGLSRKTARGRHTTRHTEIFPLGARPDDGFCFDTPGFTSLDFSHIKKDGLAPLFREFLPFIGLCRFANCSHTKEADCAVKASVGRAVHPARYESYLKMRGCLWS